MPWPFRKPKKSYSLEEIAPNGLFDIHSHILPGLDDGARTWEESVDMARGYAGLGYVKIAATPHFDIREDEIELAVLSEMVETLIERAGEHCPIIVAGGEVLFDERFDELASENRLPRIGVGDCHLFEFGFGPGSIPPGIEDFTFRFQIKRGTLILAHPERYSDFQKDPKRLHLLARSGVLLQVDLMSLTGAYGQKARRMALELFEGGHIDIAASDLHRADDLPVLRRGLQVLAEMDRSEFKRLVSNNPRAVLAGRLDDVVRYA
jgi:protein-tyrosine phosphatase